MLRYDRRSIPDPARERAGGAVGGSTTAEVGRSLSRERTRQGLSLGDVRDRTGIPVEQLRAAETGVIDRPDALATLKTVRRYADFLGLPGDRYALAILEHWPTAALASLGTTAGQGPGGRHTYEIPGLGGPDTNAGAATRRSHGGGGAGNGNGSAGTLYLAPPGAHGATGEIATLMAFSPPGSQGQTDPYGYPYGYADTGIAPALPAGPHQVLRRARRRGASVALQVLVGVVSFAVVAGIALLAVDRLRPAWLREIGLLRSTGGAPAAAAAPAASHHSATAALRAHTTSRTSAVFYVPASTFTATVSAVGGPCWVEVTAGTASAPTYAGTLQPGSSQRFSGSKSLVVDLGSTAGRVSIAAAHVRSTTYAPRAIPFALTLVARP